VGKLSGGRCAEAILIKAEHHSLARRLEGSSSILPRPWTALFRHRRRLVPDARLTERRYFGAAIRAPRLAAWGGDVPVDLLEAEIRVRAKAHELQYSIAGLSVDQHQVRFHVAVAKVLPLVAQRMIDVLCGERDISREKRYESRKQIVEARCLGVAIARW